MYDLLIKNATIVDGTGKPAFMGSVGVKNGKIALTDASQLAEKVIDATGLNVTPGFIDIHSHGDMVLGADYAKMCKVSQGITTEVAGQCGSSMFPVNPECLTELKELLAVCTLSFPDEMENWTTYEKYCNYVEQLPLAANVKLFTGHNTIRIAVMGYDKRKPTEDEMGKMKAYLKDAMENGSTGLSSGLVYSPGGFCDKEEIIELAKVIKPYGGIYSTHVRSESSGVVEAVAEALEIGREAEVPVIISHHKACGRMNWGLPNITLKMITDARAEGMMVTLDQYPYTAAMSHLNVCIPSKYFDHSITGLVEYLKDHELRKKITQEILDPSTPFENWYLNCGGWDNIFISALSKTPEYAGMFVSEVANKMRKNGFEAYYDLNVANEGLGSCIYYCIGEEDLCNIIQAPDAVVGTDGICRAMQETAHPRAWGAFPHAFCYFHKEKGLLTMEEMIRKMTSLPAERAMIKNKGVIADTYDADLVIFNYKNFCDRADYKNSNQLTDGIEYVIVDGKIVYQDRQLTGINPGKFIRHNP